MAQSVDRFPDFTSYLQTLDLSLDHSLKIIHVNIRSIRKHWNQLLVLIKQEKQAFDVIVLSEISISDDMTACYSLTGYQAFFSHPFTRQGWWYSGLCEM